MEAPALLTTNTCARLFVTNIGYKMFCFTASAVPFADSNGINFISCNQFGNFGCCFSCLILRWMRINGLVMQQISLFVQTTNLHPVLYPGSIPNTRFCPNGMWTRVIVGHCCKTRESPLHQLFSWQQQGFRFP